MNAIDEFIADVLIQDFINELVGEALLILEPFYTHPKAITGGNYKEWIKLHGDAVKNNLLFSDRVLKGAGRTPEQRKKSLIIVQKETLCNLVGVFDRDLASRLSSEIIQTAIPHWK